MKQAPPSAGLRLFLVLWNCGAVILHLMGRLVRRRAEFQPGAGSGSGARSVQARVIMHDTACCGIALSESHRFPMPQAVSKCAFHKEGVTMKTMMAALAMACMCVVAHAEGSNWRLFGGLGFGNGGDTITSGNITNVSTGAQTAYEIKPGGGTQYKVGIDYRVADRLTLQVSYGYSSSDPMGYNGSLTFTSSPAELLAFVNLTEGLRIGGGARKTTAEMKGTGVAAGWWEVGAYDSSPGTVVEAQYLVKMGSNRSQFGLSLRYVAESFTHNSVTFNGNHYEVGMALYY
jgi:hypothetical protein